MKNDNYCDKYDEQLDTLTMYELIQLLVGFVVIGGIWIVYFKIKNLIKVWNKRKKKHG